MGSIVSNQFEVYSGRDGTKRRLVMLTSAGVGEGEVGAEAGGKHM